MANTEKRIDAAKSHHQRRRSVALKRREIDPETAIERDDPEYLDEDGLHERYLVSPRTAQRWRASGGGPPYVRLGRRRILYRRADVEDWLASQTYQSRADELARQSRADEPGRFAAETHAETTKPDALNRSQALPAARGGTRGARS
jgi:hypothetical protein